MPSRSRPSPKSERTRQISSYANYAPITSGCARLSRRCATFPIWQLNGTFLIWQLNGAFLIWQVSGAEPASPSARIAAESAVGDALGESAKITEQEGIALINIIESIYVASR